MFSAGGVGTGHFRFTPQGEFRGWRLDPGVPERDEPVAADRFHLWVRRGRGAQAFTLASSARGRQPWGPGIAAAPESHALFPVTRLDYAGCGLPIHLSATCFSPLIPGPAREACLPVYVTAWRAENLADEPAEVALMLTWACAWPDLVPGATFEMQHDNLCITGALGAESSARRIGIAVPDLHYESIYQQGMEPWDAAGDGRELWNEFAAEGELEPAVARGESLGAAAWVKFALRPGEAKEAPFVVVWHLPDYLPAPGMDAVSGHARRHTRFLEKFRPDNAVVWLAEEVVQHYGAETANFRYWLQQIQDWHDSLRALSPDTDATRARINGLAALLEIDTAWSADGPFAALPTGRMGLAEARTAFDSAVPIARVWPELAGLLKLGE